MLAGLVDFWARTFGAIPLRSRVFLWLTLLGPNGPKCLEAVSGLQPATGECGMGVFWKEAGKVARVFYV